ncbi:hypothetical protein POPTR_009G054450v4 [Populus trichocarpa]|uniref:Uncharacterized protein n=1 Tax=Populus trichocarpa TaxID=3694 RepID=A0ACC0SGM5_POPTR|nr:hypothetical protein POPTR_009G054450v4 [Populus trichocarpa]
MLMAWPAAQVIVPVGIIFKLSGLIVINLIQFSPSLFVPCPRICTEGLTK